MSKAFDIAGQRFGRLLVVERDKNASGRWKCVCDCGASRSVMTNWLTSGNTKSCGCLAKDVTAKRNKKHGMYGTPTYNSWWAMVQRCGYPKHIEYARYGARGISVCERWKSFDGFLADMGERPVGMTIDRIDNAGNYEPGNCRWATRLQQANNCRKNTVVEYGGQALSIADWSRQSGIGAQVISKRLRRNWPAELAITLPNGARLPVAAREERSC